MVRVEFAKAFHRHVVCPPDDADGNTVGDVLAAYFDRHPGARSYVLDDAGAVRRHVAIFCNDDLIADRTDLTDAVGDGDRLHVFQALSGG